MHKKHEQAKRIKLNIVIIMILLVIFYLMSGKTYATVTTIEPREDQFLEMRATTIEDVTGQNKQILFELWSHNLDFKGFESTFEYDDTKFKLSKMSTNELTDDESEYFKFENEFDGKLDLFVTNDERENVVDMTVSLKTPLTGTTHIVDDGTGEGTYKVTTDDVLIGKMSFQMLVDEFDLSGFKLVTNTYTPTTGIRIDISLTEAYEKQSTFRFTDQTASKNAYLSDLVVSNGVVDEESPANSTYKEYSLDPIFDKETYIYEITLLEYVDTVDIKATEDDSTATMKIKVPKIDTDGKLEYEVDGTTIRYEEKNLIDKEPLEVTLNKLRRARHRNNDYSNS